MRSYIRQPARYIVVGLAAAIALTGCTMEHSLTDSQPLSTSATPQTESTHTPTPASTPSTSPTDSTCSPKQDDSNPEISGQEQQIAVDGGPRDGATGTALLDPSGVPVAYVVAPDDDPDVIADRFCVGFAYLSDINGPRRGGATQLFAGDTLNLDAETVTTVGDINGEVCAHARPVGESPELGERDEHAHAGSAELLRHMLQQRLVIRL